jgi:multiple sugar transport system permease protein
MRESAPTGTTAVVKRGLAPAWVLVGPALVILTVFFAAPVLAAFALSLTDFDLYALARPDRLRFVGLGNYRALLAEPRFWRALGNTAYFVLVGGPLSIGLSLGAACLLDARAVRWKPFFRTVLFLPVVTTLVAVAIVWRALYHPRAGLLAWICSRLGIAPIDWLGDPTWAMPAIILLAVWKNFGFNMLVFLAGLQSVPERLHEAARLDGAGAWQGFRRVTLPLLAPTFGFVAVTTTIGYLQLFAEPYVMTQGGPAESTLSIVLLMYEEGFRWWNLGFAAAVAFVLFTIILLVTGLQLAARRLASREPA